MSSGKRETVLIFCVSPISKLYLDPVKYYEPDIVHVFIGNGNDSLSSAERKIYESHKGEICCKDMTEHYVDTSDYEEILGSIIEIKKSLFEKYGEDLDIFVNITSGTHEFAAAGSFASMLPQQAVAFRVKCDFAGSEDDAVRFAAETDEKITLSEPEKVTGLKNDAPDDEMIEFLKIVEETLVKKKYPKYRLIIDRLKEIDAWSYDPERKSGYGKTSLEEKEERYLKRHYISVAMENGWLERPSPKTMVLTEQGKAYVSTYSPRSEFPTRSRRMYFARRTTILECPRMEKENLMFDEILEFENKSSTVTVGKKKKYTIKLEMDQHW